MKIDNKLYFLPKNHVIICIFDDVNAQLYFFFYVSPECGNTSQGRFFQICDLL